MNEPYARVNQPNATLTLASPLREMFGVQLYKNNARALLSSRILSILNLDWLQHARSVRGVYEYNINVGRALVQLQTVLEETKWLTISWHCIIIDNSALFPPAKSAVYKC